MVRRALVLWLAVFAVPVFAVDYAPSPSDRAAVIVEFAGVPGALAHDQVTAALHRNTFARFRADLAKLDPALGKRAVEPEIAHEYSTVLFGAAVTVAPDAVARLRQLPYVIAVHDDIPVEAHQAVVVNDAGARVNALGLGTRGRGITIAIIDTGVDYEHPAIAPNYGGGWDFVNKDADPRDDNGHGTHVAGIAAGNSVDIQGVAPEATIIGYKVLGANGSGSSSNIIAAMERAADPNLDGSTADHLDVMNLSLGARAGTADGVMARAADNAVAAGVITTISAGNSGGIGMIGSPGTSRRAITVAALNSNLSGIASFSSRGPTPGLGTHKPDVSAPGQSIVSARAGGGTVAFSGTSMAAPHVAGAAALLVALHPDWSPEQIKSALVTRTDLMFDDGFTRGSGKMNVGSAVDATLQLSETGLAFPLSHATTGTNTDSRSFRITNRGGETQTLTAVAANTPSGVTVAITPSTLTLAPGESRDMTVQLTTDNTRLRPPTLVTMGASIAFSGSSIFAVPWTFVRGARATISYDGGNEQLFAFGSDSTFRQPVALDIKAAELYTPAGVSHDLVLLTSDTAARKTRVVSQTTTFHGDEQAAMTTASATLKLDMQARTPEGVRLADLPTSSRRVYYSTIRFANVSSSITATSSVSREILVSPLPNRISIDPAEIYLDLDALRGYNAQYARQTGMTASVTLTNEPYGHARVRWPAPRTGPGLFQACWFTGDTTLSVTAMGSGTCLARSGDTQELTFDLFTTPEANSKLFTAFAFFGNGISSIPFRERDGSIVASFDRVPSALVHRTASGGDVVVGNGPFYPFQFFGTTGSLTTSFPPPGFVGPYGELRTDAMFGGYFTMRDATGAIIGSGPLDANRPAPRLGAGHRYQVISGNFNVAGRVSRGVLDVAHSTAANPTDLLPPTIGSMRLLGSKGVPTDVLARGEAATLEFSAADYGFESPGVVGALSSRADATKAWFRISGSRDWRPLVVSKASSEIGSRSTLGHLAYGDLYRADMKDATALGDVMVDLKIEIEDMAGNHVTWTQEPAFAVGAPPPQARRRAK